MSRQLLMMFALGGFLLWVGWQAQESYPVTSALFLAVGAGTLAAAGVLLVRR